MAFHLAEAGVSGMEHPGTIKKQIEATARAIARVESFIAAGKGIPGPSKLEVVEQKIATPPGPQEGPVAS